MHLHFTTVKSHQICRQHRTTSLTTQDFEGSVTIEPSQNDRRASLKPTRTPQLQIMPLQNKIFPEQSVNLNQDRHQTRHKRRRHCIRHSGSFHSSYLMLPPPMHLHRLDYISTSSCIPHHFIQSLSLLPVPTLASHSILYSPFFNLPSAIVTPLYAPPYENVLILKRQLYEESICPENVRMLLR